MQNEGCYSSSKASFPIFLRSLYSRKKQMSNIISLKCESFTFSPKSLFLAGGKFLFFAADQAADIAPVHKDHQRPAENSKSQTGPSDTQKQTEHRAIADALKQLQLGNSNILGFVCTGGSIGKNKYYYRR